MNTQVLMVVAKGKIELLDRELPPLGETDVLLRVRKSLVSPGTERAFILGLDNTTDNYPFRSGYSAVCTVAETGSAVTRFRPGDRVCCFGTSHQNFDVQPQEALVKVPDGVGDESAVFGSLGLICMQGVRKARIELGESCAVIGLGPIGQIALQLAKANGAVPVLGVDKAENRRSLAEECGAAGVFASCADMEPDSVEVVIEGTGFPDAVQGALDIAAYGGRVSLLGSTRGTCTLNVYRDLHKKGLTVTGAHVDRVPAADKSSGRWTRRQDLAAFLALLERGSLHMAPLITERCHHRDILPLYYDKILRWDPGVVGAVIDWE